MSRPRDEHRIAAVIEDAEWIASHGGTLEEAATRLGLRAGTLYDLLRKEGRIDLNHRLSPHGR